MSGQSRRHAAEALALGRAAYVDCEALASTLAESIEGGFLQNSGYIALTLDERRLFAAGAITALESFAAALQTKIANLDLLLAGGSLQ